MTLLAMSRTTTLLDDSPLHHVRSRAYDERWSDFWTTRCERCPEAIAKLNDFAGAYEQKDQVGICGIRDDAQLVP